MTGFAASTLHAQAASGDVILNGWCSIPDPSVAEVMALQGWTTVTADLQHGLLDFQRALDLIRAIQGCGKPAFARIPMLEEEWLAMKLLDAGADGLICPNVSSSDQARRFVSACTYPPSGHRSFGPTRATLIRPDYAATADAAIVKAVQIEDARAVSAVHEIASVEGVDMLYIGPADLSLAYGQAPRLDPEYPVVLAAYEKVVEACNASGVIAGIHCLTPAYAARMYALGFRFMSIASDMRLFARIVAEAVTEASAAVRKMQKEGRSP